MLSGRPLQLSSRVLARSHLSASVEPYLSFACLTLHTTTCCILLGQVFFILFCSIFVVESPALDFIASAHGLFLLTGFKMNITCHTSDDINTTVVLPNGHPAGQTHLTHAIRCFLTLALVLRLGLDFPSTLTGGLDCPVSTSLVS